MKTILTAVAALVLLTGAHSGNNGNGGNPHVGAFNNINNHVSNHATSSSRSNSGATSVSSSGASANNQTLNIIKAPATYYGDDHVVVGGGEDAPSLFIVKPNVVNLGAGVQMRDGQVFVDGQSSTCDQAGRGGLPKCFTIGGK